jgi:hypothetical protein
MESNRKNMGHWWEVERTKIMELPEYKEDKPLDTRLIYGIVAILVFISVIGLAISLEQIVQIEIMSLLKWIASL